MNKHLKALISELCLREKGKVEVNVAQMTEIVCILADLFRTHPVSLAWHLWRYGRKRAKQGKTKGEEE